MPRVLDRRAFSLLLAVLLAGCTGGAPSAPGPQEEAPKEVEPGLFVGAGQGVLRGTVYNDASLPVPRARVGLIGTEHSAETDATGRYQFVNVTGGPHRLRTEATGFRFNETDLRIEPGNITVLDVYLIPTDAGYAPHVHDYWQGATEYVLMDDDVSFSNAAGENNLNDSKYVNSRTFFVPPPKEGRLPIVLPGTKEIRVWITWNNGQYTGDRLGLQYTPRKASGSGFPLVAGPAAPNTPLTIVVKKEWQDPGHAQWTGWFFWICPCNDVRRAPDYDPAMFLGPIHIKMVLVKGDVFLEPEHPRFWEDGDVKVLRPRGNWELPSQDSVGQRSPRAWCLKVDAGKIVPPGSARMRIEFAWKYATGNGTAADFDYTLTWRVGTQGPYTTPFSAFKRAPAKYDGDHVAVYEISLAALDPDPFYADRSNWCFAPSVVGHEDEDRLYDYGRSLTFDLGVTVWKDPAYL